MHTVGCKENVKSLYWRNLRLCMKVLSCLVAIQVKLAQEGLKCKSVADSLSIKRWGFFPINLIHFLFYILLKLVLARAAYTLHVVCILAKLVERFSLTVISCVLKG